MGKYTMSTSEKEAMALFPFAGDEFNAKTVKPAKVDNYNVRYELMKETAMDIGGKAVLGLFFLGCLYGFGKAVGNASDKEAAANERARIAHMQRINAAAEY